MAKKIISILLVIVTIFSIFSIDVFADAPAFTSSFSLGLNGTEVEVTVTTTVNNAEKVNKHIKKYGWDGNVYYMNKKYQANPRTADYVKIGTLDASNGFKGTVKKGDTSKPQTIPMSKSVFESRAKVEKQNTYKPSIIASRNASGSTQGSVTFSWKGHEQLTHQAYFFPKWAHYTNDFKDIDDFNNGLAYNYYLDDPNTAYVIKYTRSAIRYYK